MKKIFAFLIILVIVVVAGMYIYSMQGETNVSASSIEYNFYKYYNGEKFGVIDKKGNVIIPANYEDIIVLNPQYAIFFLVQNDEVVGVVNEKNENIFTQYGKVLPIPVTGLVGEIPYEKQVLIYEENGKQGLLDINGKKLTKAKYNSIKSLPYKEGEIIATSDKNTYILTSDGKEKVKLSSGIDIIADGYYDANNSNEKSGYIISEPTSNGMMYGYIDYKGKRILDMEYDRIERIASDDNYLIVMKNGKYGLYKNNDVIINCNYQEMQYDDSLNLYFVRRGNLHGVLNENGNIIVPVEYQEVENKGIFIEATKDENIHERFNLNGEKTTQFDSFNSVEKCRYDDTYIGISDNYVYGILDNNYNKLTTKNYEYVENVLPGVYIVKEYNGKYGAINEQNMEVIEDKYDIIQLIDSTEILQALDVETNMTILYDKMGNKILEEKDIFTLLGNGYLKVFCDNGIKYFSFQGKEISSEEIYKNNKIIGFYENGKWGFKDRNNNVVVEAKYDRIVEIGENGYGGIKLNDKWGIIDENGNIIVEPKFYIDDNISEPEFLNKFYKNYYASEGAFYVE